MSSDLRTELNDCDATTGWVGDGTTPSADSTAGFFYEGSAAISTQHSNVAEHAYTTEDSLNTGTFSIDFSDVTMYSIVKDNLLQTAANGGIQLVIGDGTDRVGFGVGGNDDPGMPLDVFWNTYKLDVTERANAPYNNVYAGVLANLTVTAITQVGVGTVHLAKAQGNVDNIKIDAIKYVANGSYALRINGGTSGTPETTADVEGDSVTNGWGMVSNPAGAAYTFFAPTEWGEPAANADAYFAATDEQWTLYGGAVGATHFPFRVVGNATDTIDWKLTRVVITNVGTRAEFDLSDANVDVMQLDTCVFNELGAITMPVQDATNKFADDCIFNNCAQAYLSTLDMDGGTFNGTTDALGAILWDANANPSNQDNLAFNSDGTGHAIEISLNTASLTTFNISGYEVSGYETANDGSTGNTVFLVDNALDGDVTINITGGVGTFSYERAAGYTGTVTINQTVNVTITVVDQNGDAIEGAAVFLEEDPGGTDIISYDLTNVSGQVSATFAGSTPQAVTGFVRKGTSSPVYKSANINDTIGASGLSATITLVLDE